MGAFCRDCLTDAGTSARCPKCYSPRIARHDEIDTLTIAHVTWPDAGERQEAVEPFRLGREEGEGGDGERFCALALALVLAGFEPAVFRGLHA